MFVRLASAALIALSTAPALAQSSGAASDEVIVLYDEAAFEGQSLRLDGEAPDLRYVEFNDRTTSMRVESGRWKVCLDADYGGECHILRADMADMRDWAFDNRITSVRPVRFEGPFAEPGITLWSEPGYAGRSVTLTDAASDLATFEFDEQAQSVEIHSGFWTVCVEAGFESGCRELDRNVSDLRRLRMDGRISAVRPSAALPEPITRDPYTLRRDNEWSAISGGTRGVNTVFFAEPDIAGSSISACLDTDGQSCGRDAANALCREARLGRALHFNTRFAGEEDLIFLGDQARAGGEEALVDVLCAFD